MGIKAALHQYLATQVDLIALVPAVRIFRTHRPATTALPAITFNRDQEIDDNHQTGASGLSQITLGIDIWAATDSGAEAIRDKLRAALHSLANTTIGSGGDVTSIDRFWLAASSDSVEFPSDASDVHIYHISTEWEVDYRTTIPSH